MTNNCLAFFSIKQQSLQFDLLGNNASSSSKGLLTGIGLRLLLCLLLLPASLSLAQTSTEQNQSDIRVLIDVSGSMKQNDPRNLRRPAMDLLVQLFPDDSRAGIWTFGRYVNMLVPHKDVAGSWREIASTKSRLVNSVALHTNIALALEKANYDSNEKDYPDSLKFNKSVILLTDGVVDISTDPAVNDKERERILNEILPQYQAAGIAIHAIALSTNADVELLERLSIETDGVFAVAEDAEDLNRIFLRAFDQSAPGDRTPLDGNRFLIDSSVEEFTALVFRKEGSEETQIESPGGQVFNASTDGSSVRWFASEAYDLITIDHPQEGEWKINAEMDPENRVTVVSDLSLNIDPIANNLYHGQESLLNARLTESGEPVTRDEFLDLLTVEAQMSRGYTKFWQQTLPRDYDTPGVYGRKLDMLRNSGDYALTVSIDGKTFKREKTIKFTVREPFRVELAANEELGEYTLTVMADDKKLRIDSVAVTAVIGLPDGTEITKVLDTETPGVWSYHAIEQTSGEYLISLTAAGENIDGEKIELGVGEHSLFMSVPGVPEPIVIAEPIVELEPIPEPEPETEDVVEQEPIVESVPTAEAEPAAEPSGSNWILYVGLALGNLLLIGAMVVVYKKLTGTKVSAEDEAAAEQAAAEEPAKVAAEESDDDLELDADDEAAVKESASDEQAGEENAVEDSKAEESGDDAFDLDADDLGLDGEEAVADIELSADDDDVDVTVMDDTESSLASSDVESEVEDSADADDFDEIDLDAMLDVDEETTLPEADDDGAEDDEINISFDDFDDAGSAAVEDDVDLEDDIEAILADADTGDAGNDVASTEPEDDEDITLDLDGEFDLSSDISDLDDGDKK